MPSFLKNATDGLKRSGKTGFGGRLFFSQMSDPILPPSEATIMGGIQQQRGPNVMSNPVNAVHTQSPDGFAETMPGVRNPGMLEMEAIWHPNDIQGQREIDAFMQSLYGSPIINHPDLGGPTPFMDCFIVLTSAANAVWHAKGWAMAMTPVPLGIESLMSCTYGFHCSGKPNMMRGTVHPAVDAVGGSIPANITIPGTVKDTTYLVRLVLPNKYDSWLIMESVADGAVSYTHLTLPTIYSV